MTESQHIFSFFHIQDVPQELSEKLQDVFVERINYYQKSQRLEIFVKAGSLIDSSVFAQAEKLIAQQAFPEQQIKIDIVPRFVLKDPPPVAELLNAYHDNIVWELKNRQKDVLLCMLYAEAEKSMDEKGLTLRTTGKFLADFKGQALLEYLKKLFRERFDIPLAVFLEVCDDPEMPQKWLSIQEQERERLFSQIAASKTASSGKTPSANGQSSLLLYGKNTEGPITKMENLDDLVGEAVIRGRILSVEERKTKKGDKLLFLLTLTDDTDSIMAKLFFKKSANKKSSPK